MSAHDDGGPAFPVLKKVGPDWEARSIGGMTLRDWFASHAPIDAQDWFTPSLPPEPKEDWRVGEWRFDNYNYALEHTRKHGGVAANANATAQKQWEIEVMRQTEVQWPWAWADAMLAARKEKSR